MDESAEEGAAPKAGPARARWAPGPAARTVVLPPAELARAELARPRPPRTGRAQARPARPGPAQTRLLRASRLRAAPPAAGPGPRGPRRGAATRWQNPRKEPASPSGCCQGA